MPLLKLSLILAITSIIVLSVVFLLWPKQNAQEAPPNDFDDIYSPIMPYSTQSAPMLNTPSTSPVYSSPSLSPVSFIEPAEGFVQRVTKKPFGLYVKPSNSPVEPERFSGYHTGADAEYTDTESDVPVKSITDGIVRSSRRSNGYGGIVVIEHLINSQPRLVIYGHLDPARLMVENSSVAAGETIGYLGRGFSTQTDGERKHLHLAILSGTQLDLRGYVLRPEELALWVDPISLYPTPNQ